jgi:hypothetical protein
MTNIKGMETTKQIKLYTEEQVIELTKSAFVAGLNHNSFIFGQEFEKTNPIEIPSNEEIYEQAKSQSTFAPSFIFGAEWMRNKIIGGIK